MTLVDTSVWADHLRAADSGMTRLLDAGQIAMHPFILGEISLGHLKPRHAILDMLASLPSADVADEAEILQFIEKVGLFGTGIGYVDVHILASARLAFTPLWTRGKRLRAVAERLGIAAKGLK